MYKEILKEIDNKKAKIRKEIAELQEKLNTYDNSYIAIEELQLEYDKENGNLAIQKGICPFPNECKESKTCTKSYCNADECSNGYCFRRS